jgi:hypothetical protein
VVRYEVEADVGAEPDVLERGEDAESYQAEGLARRCAVKMMIE